ncbi:MAG: serine/threonine protein kinase [Polyangiaceae bacterium]|nr:serine/threonine protein kinase [Polyangiaceae bacterium]
MDSTGTRPSLAPLVLTVGAVFAGRYRVVRTIASGGMGVVYEAIHTETGRRRALKIMHAHLFESDEMRQRFKTEAQIAGQVESEYIVDVSDAGVDEASQAPFIAMELLQGEDLGQRLKRVRRLTQAEALPYLQQVSLALDKTHAHGIVHRDLKPDNVFLTTREDGTTRIKILDFGVAKLVAESATSAGTTRSLGTPLYMAPEQFRVGSRLLPAADIYALGMMTYTLLVGQAYWSTEAKSAGDVIAFAMAVVQGPQESAVHRAAQSGVTLPPRFDQWFIKATAHAPEDRFASASEAIRALGVVLAPAPVIQTRPPSQAAPVVPRVGAVTVPISRSLPGLAPSVQPPAAIAPQPAVGIAPQPQAAAPQPAVAAAPQPAVGIAPQPAVAAAPQPQAALATLHSPGPPQAPLPPTPRSAPKSSSHTPAIFVALSAVLLLGAGVAYLVFGRADSAAPDPLGSLNTNGTVLPAVTEVPTAATSAFPSSSGSEPSSHPMVTTSTEPTETPPAPPAPTGKSTSQTPKPKPTGQAVQPTAKPTAKPLLGRD